MWRSRLKAIINVFFRNGGVYSVYFVSILIAIAILCFVENRISTINADFEPPAENMVGNGDTGGNGIVYNYFLDFSPSMQGFLYEDINTDMRKVADVFEQFNANNEDNRFYWCRDELKPIEAASDFYESMRSDSILNRYYGQIQHGIVPTENSGEETEEDGTGNALKQVIDNIDLSDIFKLNNRNALEEGMSDLNVIVTDLNFFRNSSDSERHNQLIDNFAQGLCTAAANSNICIYAVNSNYGGAGLDAYDGNRGSATFAFFYVIIFSENESRYVEFCSRFEETMALSSVQKFELRNHLNGEASALDGNLATFRALGLGVEKENLNYADGVFQDLGSNEFALQLVTGDNDSAVFTAPVAEVDFSGYGVADIVGLDDSKIGVEIDLYQNKIQSLWRDSYEIYDDPSMVLDKSAGMYYAANKWFLRVNLRIGTYPNVPEPDSWLGRWMTGMRRNHIVMNLRFYMERPSFSMPAWVAETGYPVSGGEEIHGIEAVIGSVIQHKEEVYATQPLNERYLGNKVIYLLY